MNDNDGSISVDPLLGAGQSLGSKKEESSNSCRSMFWNTKLWIL